MVGYTRKYIHNGCSVRIKNSITRYNCSTSASLLTTNSYPTLFEEQISIIDYMNILSLLKDVFHQMSRDMTKPTKQIQ